ncbi:hypothetical protein CC78DRAFT_533992 [Lojkania enalia]|uniref:C2H2-type domain-containing protein n=1 Tax=Lojkania enalia TaxID=147567 RepID=A0A9P4K778_9PLEO|nr:hypothetical protein CC78DRAFT_533992 [Didymosphaeria enalia]
MVGPMKRKFHCGMCEMTFVEKFELQQHVANHSETRQSWKCGTCNRGFDDELALDRHQLQIGHGPANRHQCPRCPKTFPTPQALDNHRKFPSRCADAFSKTYPHKERPVKRLNDPTEEDNSVLDYGLPAPTYSTSLAPETDMLRNAESSPDPPSTTSNGEYCAICKKPFPSLARYNNHFLGCRPPRPVQPLTTIPGSPTVAQIPVVTVSITPPANSRPIETVPIPAPLESQTAAVQGQSCLVVKSLETPINDGSTFGQSTSQAKSGGETRVIGQDPAVNILHLATPKDLDTANTTQIPPAKAQDAILPKSRSQSRESLAETSKPSPSPTKVAKSTISPTILSAPFKGPKPHNIHTPNEHKCNIGGCPAVFRSELGLKTHQKDAHDIGGKGLDLMGADVWMLSNREQNRLKSLGVFPQSSVGRGAARGRARAGRGRAPSQGPPLPVASEFPEVFPVVVSGLEEIQQAETICGQILRLVLQSDFFINHDGSITHDGINWMRIEVAKQSEVIGLFDRLCHLPRPLQMTEYFPAPRTFRNEYQILYPIADFTHSPESGNSKCLPVVTLACSKILLANGLREVVKIAAIDVLTCRILMNYLVCTNPKVAVRDWRTPSTGLSSFGDMELARRDGYKVLKGWKAAKAALYKFIDKNTIILGYNLRADLDALRMIHGRGVDIAKAVEKAANGPLSKMQLSLESLCRDFPVPSVTLTTHPHFGRDCLQNAFAVRQFGLWMLKNDDKFKIWARQQSLDYQRIAPSVKP